MKRSIPELARRLKSNPADECALYATFKALRDQGLVRELVTMLELWMEAERGEEGVPERALAELYVCIARRSPDAKARELCRLALDLWPDHFEALSRLERLVDPSCADELCARYENFLQHAPTHPAAPRIRNAMIAMSVVAHYHGASHQTHDLPSTDVCDAHDFEHAFVTALMPNPLLDSHDEFPSAMDDDGEVGDEPLPSAVAAP